MYSRVLKFFSKNEIEFSESINSRKKIYVLLTCDKYMECKRLNMIVYTYTQMWIICLFYAFVGPISM